MNLPHEVRATGGWRDLVGQLDQFARAWDRAAADLLDLVAGDPFMSSTSPTGPAVLGDTGTDT